MVVDRDRGVDLQGTGLAVVVSLVRYRGGRGCCG